MGFVPGPRCPSVGGGVCRNGFHAKLNVGLEERLVVRRRVSGAGHRRRVGGAAHESSSQHTGTLRRKESTGEHVRRGQMMVFPKSSASEIEGLRMSTMGAEVTQKRNRLRTRAHSSRSETARAERWLGVNSVSKVEDTPPAPPFACARMCLASPRLASNASWLSFEKSTRLRESYGARNVFVNDAFRNMGMNPLTTRSRSQTLSLHVYRGGVEFRLMSAWNNSPSSIGERT